LFHLSLQSANTAKTELNGRNTMVWGMYLPKGGGPYGPYGDDEGPVDTYVDGWRNRLMKNYEDHLSDAQKAFYGNARKYSFCVGDKFRYECGHKQPGRDDLIVTPIEDHEPPRFYQIEKPYTQLSSIISLSSRRWAVDEAVKVIVERFEPGVHKFYPLEIRMPRGKIYPVQYYAFVVGNWVQSFSPEDSVQDIFRMHETNGVRWFNIRGDKASITGLALRQSVYKNAHLWRERGFNEWLICFSDELAAKFTTAELVLPK
jgi:hypothetical protein